ncbi:MAG: rRNA pseudouridine synthase [Candidatus Omnitrophica bacterium]|nr:rRNA pseudouridine synthase [Candidatus Omnitrophota bacterium]
MKNATETVRLNVFLSRHGVCSRRDAMQFVLQGRVRIAGAVVREPSSPVAMTAEDIAVDGKLVKAEKYSYIMLNKPAGYTTTKSDRYAEKVVYELLPPEYRQLPTAGRLDQDSEGLLLFTNDGDVNLILTHPRYNADKVYVVVMRGELTREEKRQIESGVIVEGKKTAPARISDVVIKNGQTQARIKIHEGRKRQVRRMFAAVGHEVIKLVRMSQGPLVLGNLAVGKWRHLTAAEVKALKI